MVKKRKIGRIDSLRKLMHGNRTADIHADMVGIDVCAYFVNGADIAGITGMHVRHLQDFDTPECRVVALLLDPLQGRLLNIVGKNFSGSVFS